MRVIRAKGKRELVSTVTDSFLEIALEYRKLGIETTVDFLYDEWKRRYVPPQLDPPTSRLAPLYSTLLAGSPSPKPAYRDRYSEDSPRIGRTFLFGFVTDD